MLFTVILQFTIDIAHPAHIVLILFVQVLKVLNLSLKILQQPCWKEPVHLKCT